MKQLTLNNKNFLFVEVPNVDNYFSIEYHENHLDKYLHFISDYYRGLPNYDSIDLPPGNWSGQIKASEVSEEQAAAVVYCVPHIVNTVFEQEVYKDYCNNGSWFDTSTESLYSLIRSIGMETEKTVILIEK